ncbi:pyridoxamine 5'-phosphate oxidase family protein [Haladaptatus sp. DJG-WS-42]|uniref:pyridoxamine 5'-phosphate oxidase family protein n=1 Tax=Haladaptatus sp. DJG-WS-42 TaxID=3120516 RepID=UPI0030D04AE2
MTIDDLGEYGVVRMDDEEVTKFLSSQHVGVLSLPTDGAPSMRPLSFWFDGKHRLYFLYLGGESGRKALLSDEADTARFLVYRAETMFNWRSILLTGTISQVEDDQHALDELMALPQRPDLFKEAIDAEETVLYRFDITEQTGIKHLGLPAGLEAAESDDPTV